jgi:hypothetical protein
VWAASLDSPDAPVATARYVGPSPSVSTTAPPNAPALAPDVVEPDSPRSVNSLQSALAAARQDVGAVADQLSGLVTNIRYRREPASEVARFSASAGQGGGAPGLRQRLGEMPGADQKSRVFLFAGDQGGMVTYSFTGDHGQVGAAGWSTERADLAGERRVGFAWSTKHDRQPS